MLAHVNTLSHTNNREHWYTLSHTRGNYTHHTVTKDLRPACESLCACPLCAQSDSDGVSAGCDLLSPGWPERQTEWHLWGHHCRNNRRKGIRGQISLLSPRDCSGKKRNTVCACKSECPLLGTPECFSNKVARIAGKKNKLTQVEAYQYITQILVCSLIKVIVWESVQVIWITLRYFIMHLVGLGKEYMFLDSNKFSFWWNYIDKIPRIN